jgi:hypothetical protein
MLESLYLPLAKDATSRVDFLLILSLAAGVDARTGGVTDPQYNLVRPRQFRAERNGRVIQELRERCLLSTERHHFV